MAARGLALPLFLVDFEVRARRKERKRSEGAIAAEEGRRVKYAYVRREARLNFPFHIFLRLGSPLARIQAAIHIASDVPFSLHGEKVAVKEGKELSPSINVYPSHQRAS